VKKKTPKSIVNSYYNTKEGAKMPYGKGTYGSKVGRPKKRKKKATSATRNVKKKRSKRS